MSTKSQSDYEIEEVLSQELVQGNFRTDDWFGLNNSNYMSRCCLDSFIIHWYLLRAMGGGSCYQGYINLAYDPMGDEEWQELMATVSSEAFATNDRFEEVKVPYYLHNYMSLVQVGNQSLSGALTLFGGAIWYDCGMPSVEIGHKLAASLMVTGVPDDVMDEIQMPFPAMVIQVPPGLLEVVDSLHNDRLTTITKVLVGRIPIIEKDTSDKPIENPERGWFYMAMSDSTLSYHGHGNTLSRIFGAGTLEGYPDSREDVRALDLELDDVDARVVNLIGRLCASTLLCMTTDGLAKPVGKGNEYFKSGTRQTERGEPVRRVFRLTPKVNHDFREPVRDYVRGTGKKLTVQSIVAGHWKRQAYGKRHSLRRMQFIEPYWRGPEDAPIALRPHTIGKDKNGG